MNIVLLRHGNRALLLPADRSLIDCPPAVRLWLDTPELEVTAELTARTPMPGIHLPTVLAEIHHKGFCALDVTGVVRRFSARPDGGADAPANDLPPANGVRAANGDGRR